MSNVMMLPSGRGQLEQFLQQWMERRQQQGQFDAAQKQQQGQFDASNALDVKRTEAQTGLMGAQTEGVKSTTSIAAAQAKVQGFIENTIKPMVANGRQDEAAKLAQAFIRSNPDTAAVLEGYGAERPQLDSDTAAANTQKYSADQTGIAAGGSQDVQSRAFTQENALGRAMSPQQFADQAQRQPEAGDKKTPYGQTLAIEGQRAPTANAKLQSSTQIQVGREQNASHERSSGAQAKTGQANEIADAIVSGKQPPELQRLYGLAGPVRAALAEKGYDLTKASQDWTATQRYLATLNGPAQVRLRQAIEFTDKSLDIVSELGAQWDAGGFPLLNKAQLEAAKQGALGKDAQSVATRLDSQIADLVSELAVVYKGGNSSTDESLKIAAANLKAEWSRKTLDDNITQVRENLRIRRNSINAGGTVTNANNSYTPTPGAGDGTIETKDGKKWRKVPGGYEEVH